jgi:hypothetical protein
LLPGGAGLYPSTIAGRSFRDRRKIVVTIGAIQILFNAI